MSTKLAIIQFPGSNCDQDILEAFTRHFGVTSMFVWHSENRLPKVDGVIIPGGFSFGDYLRSGALAAHSPIMQEVKSFGRAGGPVLGICNGFQILTESKMLPGALLRNKSRKFVCKYLQLQTHKGRSSYHQELAGHTLAMPIAHGEGNYYIDEEGYKTLEGEGQILFKYASNSQDLEGGNPNGSKGAIAGIVSSNGRVMGLMPHPERATDRILGGSSDGLLVLKAFLNTTM